MPFSQPPHTINDWSTEVLNSNYHPVEIMRQKLINAKLISPQQGHEGQVDNGGYAVEEDMRVWVGSIEITREAVKLAVQNKFGAMPIGALTSATKAFMARAELSAAELDGCVGLGIRDRGQLKLPEDLLDDIQNINGIPYRSITVLGGQARILESPDPLNHPHKIETWGGVIPDELDRALKSHFGPGHTIFLDLTTRNQAQIAAVVATGGQGPVRANAAFNLDQVLIVDGDGQERLLEGDEAKKQVGLGGSAGVITQLRFDVIREYPNEFAFFIPLKGDLEKGLAERYPQVLALLHSHTRSDTSKKDRLVAESGEALLIKGLEIITRQGMGRTSDSSAVSKEGRDMASGLFQTMTENECEVGLMINGVADLEDDEILGALGKILKLDENDFNNESLGISSGADFYSERHMPVVRITREGVAAAARAAKDKGTTLSTDFNSSITSTDINEVERAYKAIWNIYGQYIKEFQSKNAQVDIYGHNHPGSQYSGGGVNPHIRITLLKAEGETPEEYENRVRYLRERQTQLYKDLIALHGQYGIQIAPGEKGILYNKPFIQWLSENQPDELAAIRNYIKEYGGKTFGFRALSRLNV